MLFWFGTIVFFATYIAIATEKIHKTTAALVGSALMLLVILDGPTHHGSGDSHGDKKAAVEQHTDSEAAPAAKAVGDALGKVKAAVAQPAHQTPAEIKTEILDKSAKYQKLDVFARYVNFDVVFTLAGMMLLVNVLSGTGIFQYVAIRCAKISRGSPVRTMILLVVATAVLSAFLDNVTTVLLIAPLTLLVASQLDVPAIPFLMAETIASNIGGAATLIGDPPNLIIGSVAHLNFAAFIINLTPFIIIITAIYCVFLRFHYGNKMTVTVEQRAKIMEMDEKAAITDPANMKRGGIVMILTIVGFLLHGAVGLQPCVVAMSGAALALLVCKVDVDESLEKIEWSTLFFFLGLFILVNGAEKVGLMAKFGGLLSYTADWHPLVVVLLVMWISGICAAIMNNVSFTAAMVAIIASFLTTVDTFKGSVELQHLMWWGLALAVCLGGNGTIVGAAANLVTAGIAERGGQKIDFKTFFIYGAPVTFFSLIAASLYAVVRYYLCCV